MSAEERLRLEIQRVDDLEQHIADLFATIEVMVEANNKLSARIAFLEQLLTGSGE